RVSMIHTFDSDLRVNLIGPGGATTRLLINRRGGAGINFTSTTLDDASSVAVASGTAPFAGTYKPEEALSAFNGQSAAGTWTLTVQDVESGDVGQITAWSVTFTTLQPNVAPTARAAADQTVVRGSPDGANVTLDGTASSDADGTIVTYEWIE